MKAIICFFKGHDFRIDWLNTAATPALCYSRCARCDRRVCAPMEWSGSFWEIKG